ncbi:MAG: tail fiber protein [Actinomycetota bacterium]
MPTTTAVQAITVPSPTDPVDVPGDLTTVASALELRSVMRFANTAARDASIGGALTAGMVAWTDDDNTLRIYNGSVWHPISYGDPIGTLVAYAGQTAPHGYLACDGSAYSRVAYADLFAVLGELYGAGDGSSTFNVPDLRGRVPVGGDRFGPAGAAGRITQFNTNPGGLNQTAGTERHTLVTAELPSHTHTDGTLATASAGSHDHDSGSLVTASDSHNHGASGDSSLQFVVGAVSQSTIYLASGALGDYGSPGADVEVTYNGIGNDSHNHAVNGSTGTELSHTHWITGATGASGSGLAHENMPPYQTVGWIIRATV